ncbi:MAG: RNA 2',3'-cyclic phosphodiesterase [Candidatus Moranbacteria bacterium]|jgi:2'-5' RNA ligase|nr:RNA 2',3'-cyclic phosphodiesterase [Candidatus Moranbacteria bacterium]
MQRRIFVGIDLPSQVKKRLAEKVEKWKSLPIKWIKEDNFHITLSFLGYLEDEDLSKICQSVRVATKNIDAFDIELSKIELGPEKGKNARLVWFSGKASEELKKLQEEIEKSFGSFKIDKKEFHPHVTLGRIRKNKWQILDSFPEVEENFRISLPVDSVSIFDSRSEETAGEFIEIESCPLK